MSTSSPNLLTALKLPPLAHKAAEKLTDYYSTLNGGDPIGTEQMIASALLSDALSKGLLSKKTPPPAMPLKRKGRLSPSESYAHANPLVRRLYDDFCEKMGQIGAPTIVETKVYFSFRSRTGVVATVEFQQKALKVCVGLDPSQIRMEAGFVRDVTGIGHLGSGNVEITLRKLDDLKRAEPLLVWACAAKGPFARAASAG